MQRYVSDELTHLTGRGKPDESAYEALLSILRSGVLRHSGEATPHGTFPENQLGGGVAWNPDADLVGHEMFKADIVCYVGVALLEKIAVAGDAPEAEVAAARVGAARLPTEHRALEGLRPSGPRVLSSLKFQVPEPVDWEPVKTRDVRSDQSMDRLDRDP